MRTLPLQALCFVGQCLDSEKYRHQEDLCEYKVLQAGVRSFLDIEHGRVTALPRMMRALQ